MQTVARDSLGSNRRMKTPLIVFRLLLLLILLALVRLLMED